MARSTGPTPTTVRVVWERDLGSCARCGTGLRFEDRGYGWSVHHRSPRGMGGSKVAWVNLPANLVILCGSGVTGCHGWVESYRDIATAQGWLVSRHGTRLPVEVPIMDAYDHKYWLDNSGLRHDRQPQPY